MLGAPFLKITEKVIGSIEQNPAKGDPTLEGLLKQNVVSRNGWGFGSVSLYIFSIYPGYP
jgi:hypothetical protein